MKIDDFFGCCILLIFIGCSANKTLVRHTSPSKYKMTVYQNKKDKSLLIFSFKNESEKTVQYTYHLYTLGNVFYIYTPSGKKLRHVDASGVKNEIYPNETYEIQFKNFDLHFLKNLRATETGWYKCVWRIENLDVQTEFLYYFDPIATRKKYKLDD